MSSEELSSRIAELALTKKALDVLIMEVKNLSDVTDYFVLCSGDSDTQVKAIADAIMDGLLDEGVKVWRKEGFQNLQWVLLDFVDVVVHIFLPRVREYYNLERLWADAPAVAVLDDGQRIPAASGGGRR